MALVTDNFESYPAWTELHTCNASWIRHASSQTGINIFKGNTIDGAYCTPNNGAVACTVYYYFNAIPPTADYTVSARVFKHGSMSPGVLGRCSSSVATYYRLYYAGTQWVLDKVVSGVVATLATYPDPTWSVAGTMKLTMTGTLITATVPASGGTYTFSVTDASITAAGYFGIFHQYGQGKLKDFVADVVPNSFTAPVLNLTLGILPFSVSAGATYQQSAPLNLILDILPFQVFTQNPGQYVQRAVLNLTLGILPFTVSAGVKISLPAPLNLTLGILPFDVMTLMSLSQLRGMPHYAPLFLVEITLVGGPILRFATQNVNIGTQRYEAYIANDLKGAMDSLDRQTSEVKNSDISIVFRNLPYAGYSYLVQIGDDYSWEVSMCAIYETAFDDKGNIGAPEMIFKGVLDEPTSITLASFECKVSSLPYLMDKRWQQPSIDTGTFPSAFEDVGNALPIVYGSNVLLPAQWVDAGAKTTLASECQTSDTTLTLTDASRFPGSGTVLIDSEECSYRGVSGNILTGVTKGVNSTSSTVHNAGAEVWIVQNAYDAIIACHPVAVTTVYVEFSGKFYRVSDGITTLTQSVGSRTMTYIRATKQITVDAVIDTIGVNDTIVVSDSIDIAQTDHSHNTSASGTIIGTSASSSGTGYYKITNAVSLLYDQSEGTWCQGATNNGVTWGAGRFDITVNFPAYIGGAPSAVYACITHKSAGATSTGSYIRLAGYDLCTTAGAEKISQKFNIGTAVPPSLTLTGYASTGVNGGASLYVYEIWLEVSSDSTTADAANVSKSGTATKEGAASKTGQVVSTQTIERIHALVNGYVDDPSGTYTGVPNSVIENPAHAVKHFLCVASGQFTAEAIDLPSFDTAAATYDSMGYKAAFALTSALSSPSDFLHKLAYEHRGALIFRAGQWRFNVIPDTAPSAVRTISSGDLHGLGAQFTFARTPWIEVFNNLTGRYSYDYSRVKSNSDWLGSTIVQDSLSQAKYGTFAKTVDFETVRDSDTALSVLNHMLIELKKPRLIVEFQVKWPNFDLNVGDTFMIDNPIWGGEKFYIEAFSREDMGTAKITARSWWSASGHGAPPAP